MQKELYPSGYAVTSKFSEQCERQIHTGGSIGPQEKMHKEIGSLEGRGEGF